MNLKFILLVVFSCLYSTASFSQSNLEINEKEKSILKAESCLNENGSFEITTSCASNPFAFNNSCVPNWVSVHGSPDLCSSCLQASPPPGGGNNFAALGSLHQDFSDGCRNEALFMPLDLIAGNPYTLSFYHRTGSAFDLLPIEINVLQSTMPSGVISSGHSPCSDLIIPPDHQVLYRNSEFVSENWIKETICFNAMDLIDGGLVFYTEQNDPNILVDHLWLIDLICVEDFEACEAITDLTACPAEGDFGFIAYDCPGEYFWEFDGPGASGIEFTSNEHSVLLQVTPGTYTVTYKGEDGCEVEDQWTVLESCCEKPCETPTGLWCDYTSQGVSLNWTNIPAAAGYVVTIFPNDASCGCESNDPVVEPFTIDVNSNNLTFLPEHDCFSWAVSTWCGGENFSDLSEKSCFSFKYQDCFEPFDKDDEVEIRSTDDSGSKGQVHIYPNPSMGDVFIGFELDKISQVNIEIYDLQGKKVKSLSKLGLQGKDGVIWKPSSSVIAGSYFVKVTTKYWSVTERIVLSK